MKYETIIKARRRLGDARSYLDRLYAADPMDVEELHRAWYGFIVALNAIGEILKTGSRKDPRARQIIWSKFKKMMDDPLLHFLFIARATDYHGTGNSAGAIDGDFELAYVGDGGWTVMGFDGVEHRHHGMPAVTGKDGRLLKVGDRFNPQFQLKTITDEKHGDVFAVPSEHLGQPLQDATVKTVGPLAFNYYVDWLDECEALAT